MQILQNGSESPVVIPNFKRTNLVQMVADALKENILSGKLKDGERLPTQEELAQQFGVSRTVMREALHTLSSFGLIESHQGRGTFVRSPDTKTLMNPMFHALILDEASTSELMETRYHLERIIARLAAKRISDAHIESLRGLITSMEGHIQERNFESVVKEDLLFHLQLATISNNSILKRIAETLREMMYTFLLQVSQIPGSPERAFECHKRIFQALEKRDPNLAEEMMRQHMLDIVEDLRTGYEFTITF